MGARKKTVKATMIYVIKWITGFTIEKSFKKTALKVVEWIKGRKRVALNKEREIRRTHKGGFSQEKFQRYVDYRKEQTSNWAEKTVNQQGVLKTPYDKIIVESPNPKLEKNIKEILDKLNYW